MGQLRINPDDDILLGKAYDSKITKRLLQFLVPYGPRVRLTALMVIVVTACDLLLPKLFSMAIDEVTSTQRLWVVNVIGISFVVTVVIRFLGMWGQYSNTRWLGNRVVFDIRNKMFRHLQSLSISYIDKRGVGSVMTRIQNDVAVLQEMFSDTMSGIVSNFLVLIGIIVIMLLTNWKLALLSFIVIPIMLLIMRYWQGYAKSAYRVTRRTMAIVNANLAESISGMRVVQAFTREPVNMDHFKEINNNNLVASISAARYSSLLFPLVTFLSASATATIIYVGGRFVLDETLSIGDLVLFVALIDRFFAPIRDLSQQYSTLQSSMAAGERVFEVLDVEAEVQDKPDAYVLPPVNGRVDYNQVTFGYGSTQILHDIDLHVEPGETIAFVGETGAGKSSMVNLLMRFTDVWDGSVTIDGHDVRDVTQESLRS
ncbi:MAG: ABC transporter ATP-binding protein, partial [Thermomicrobiales bacterium]